jgi:hypothetical protein
MQDSIIPAHIFYDPQVVDADLISEMISALVSDSEVRKMVHFKVVSMGGMEQVTSINPLADEKKHRVDLRIALEALVSEYKDLDETRIGTRDREVLILLGTFPVDDWLDGGEEISSYLPLIITYWFDTEGLSSTARQSIDHLLGRISRADPVSGDPRHRIVEAKDQDMRTLLQDVFGKFKNRLLEKVRAKPSFFKKG